MFTRAPFIALGFALVLGGSTGCSGGGSASPIPVHTAKPTPTPAPTATPISPTLFVASGASILEFPITATGNVTAAVTISGAATTLTSLVPMAVDSSKNIYTANDSTSLVTIFASGAAGNVAPTDTLGGGSTTIGKFVYGLAVDSTNRLYVSSLQNNTINVFPAGSSGGVAPLQSIAGNATSLSDPGAIAVDSADNIYVANGSGVTKPSITIYAPGATGNATPIQRITPTASEVLNGIAVDKSGNIYVTDAASNSIFVYGAGATGNATPIATISGSNTGMDVPTGIALDSNGRIYVANEITGHGVDVFAAGANGNVTPVAIIGSFFGSGLAIR